MESLSNFFETHNPVNRACSAENEISIEFPIVHNRIGDVLFQYLNYIEQNANSSPYYETYRSLMKDNIHWRFGLRRDINDRRDVRASHRNTLSFLHYSGINIATLDASQNHTYSGDDNDNLSSINLLKQRFSKSRKYVYDELANHESNVFFPRIVTFKSSVEYDLCYDDDLSKLLINEENDVSDMNLGSNITNRLCVKFNKVRYALIARLNEYSEIKYSLTFECEFKLMSELQDSYYAVLTSTRNLLNFFCSQNPELLHICGFRSMTLHLQLLSTILNDCASEGYFRQKSLRDKNNESICIHTGRPINSLSEATRYLKSIGDMYKIKYDGRKVLAILVDNGNEFLISNNRRFHLTKDQAKYFNPHVVYQLEEISVDKYVMVDIIMIVDYPSLGSDPINSTFGGNVRRNNKSFEQTLPLIGTSVFSNNGRLISLSQVLSLATQLLRNKLIRFDGSNIVMNTTVQNITLPEQPENLNDDSINIVDDVSDDDSDTATTTTTTTISMTTTTASMIEDSMKNDEDDYYSDTLNDSSDESASNLDFMLPISLKHSLAFFANLPNELRNDADGIIIYISHSFHSSQLLEWPIKTYNNLPMDGILAISRNFDRYVKMKEYQTIEMWVTWGCMRLLSGNGFTFATKDTNQLNNETHIYYKITQPQQQLQHQFESLYVVNLPRAGSSADERMNRLAEFRVEFGGVVNDKFVPRLVFIRWRALDKRKADDNKKIFRILNEYAIILTENPSLKSKYSIECETVKAFAEINNVDTNRYY